MSNITLNAKELVNMKISLYKSDFFINLPMKEQSDIMTESNFEDLILYYGLNSMYNELSENNKLIIIKFIKEEYKFDCINYLNYINIANKISSLYIV